MVEKLSFWHNLTEDAKKAKGIWNGVLREIKKVGREDILNNPVVLDIGGGGVNFLNISINKAFALQAWIVKI